MLAEKFQIYSVKITANTFVSQKIESVQIESTHTLKQNSPPGFYHYPLPGISLSSQTVFFEDIIS